MKDGPSVPLLELDTVREAADYVRQLEQAHWRIVGAPGTDTWLCHPPEAMTDQDPIIVRGKRP